MKQLCVVVLLASLVAAREPRINGSCTDKYVQCRFWSQRADYCNSEYYKDYMALMCPKSCKFCAHDESDEQEQPANLSGEGSGRSVPAKSSEDEELVHESGLGESDLEDTTQKITDRMAAPDADIRDKLQKTHSVDNEENDNDSASAETVRQHKDSDDALPSGEGQGSASRDVTGPIYPGEDDVTTRTEDSAGSSGSGEDFNIFYSGSGTESSAIQELDQDKNDTKEDNDDDDDEDNDDDDDDEDDYDDDDDDADDDDKEMRKRSVIPFPKSTRILASLETQELGDLASGDDDNSDLEMLEDPDADFDPNTESDPDSDCSTSDGCIDSDKESKGDRERSKIAHPDAMTSGSAESPLRSDAGSGDVTLGDAISGSGDFSSSVALNVVAPGSENKEQLSSSESSGSHEETTPVSRGHVAVKTDDDVTSPSHVASKADDDVTSPSHVASKSDDATSPSHVASKSDDATSPSHVASKSDDDVTSPSHVASKSDDDVTSPSHVASKSDDDVTSPSHVASKSNDDVTSPSQVTSKPETDVMSGSSSGSEVVASGENDHEPIPSESPGYKQEATSVSRSHVVDDDVTSGSAAGPLGSGSEVVPGPDQDESSHDIEDAIFDKGLPLNATTADASGSGHADESETKSFFSAKHRQRISLIEKMMKLGKLNAFQLSHTQVKPSIRDEVPHKIGDNIQSDLGKGTQVTLILNQDFQEDYANEETVAYDILAQSLKEEVENVVGENAVVSHIRFREVHNPGKSPQFSKVKASFKLLGDVKELKKAVRHGNVRELVVQRNFFKTS